MLSSRLSDVEQAPVKKRLRSYRYEHATWTDDIAHNSREPGSSPRSLHLVYLQHLHSAISEQDSGRGNYLAMIITKVMAGSTLH